MSDPTKCLVRELVPDLAGDYRAFFDGDAFADLTVSVLRPVGRYPDAVRSAFA